MTRTVLYGYKIQDGKLIVEPIESAVVKQIFALYQEGLSQQQIVDILNTEEIRYSESGTKWSQQILSNLLQNAHYTGRDGYPALIGTEQLCAVQQIAKSRTRERRGRTALRLKGKLRCQICGNSLRHLTGSKWTDTMHFKCECCGLHFAISDDTLLAEVERQAAEYTPPQAESGYTPSEDTVRLTNAINRGLEKPEHPEKVVALIMQGISARYACFPTQMTSADILRLIKEKDYYHAIQYITITADSAVKVAFK